MRAVPYGIILYKNRSLFLWKHQSAAIEPQAQFPWLEWFFFLIQRLPLLYSCSRILSGTAQHPQVTAGWYLLDPSRTWQWRCRWSRCRGRLRNGRFRTNLRIGQNRWSEQNRWSGPNTEERFCRLSSLPDQRYDCRSVSKSSLRYQLREPDLAPGHKVRRIRMDSWVLVGQ